MDYTGEDLTGMFFAGLSVGVIIIGIVALVYRFRSKRLASERKERDQRLEQLREHAERTKVIEYTDIDVVMFGPRQSGKTSIAELWTSPWTQIENVVASHTWRIYEADIHKKVEERRIDAVFGIERTFVPVVRVRVHDYPGEDTYRQQAIKDLRDLKKRAVAVFVFKVDYNDGKILCADENARYFSEVFVDELHNNLTNINQAVAKAIIVFNKADTLPPDWGPLTFDYLREANRDAMFQVERIFGGKVDYCITSAKTNRGIIRLLGFVGKVGMEDSPAELNRFMSNMRAAEGEFEGQRTEDRPEVISL